MSFYDMNNELSEPTSIFGLRLWVVIGICVGAFIVLILFLISLCVTYLRKSTAVRTKSKTSDHRRPFAVTTPVVTKEIQEIKLNQQPSPYPTLENSVIHFAEHLPEGRKDIQIDIGKDHRIVFSDRPSSSLASGGGGESRLTDSGSMAVPGVSHLGWGHWYTLRELEIATNGLADENVIGEGGYGIVYRGILPDNTQVAVKNLLNNRGQAEREFKGEVEAIGRVRHKNLVRLLGYCVEGAYRMLVYEYIDNGNLDLWLHGDVGQFSPLTWDIRMNIILRTAKGLAYLHEGLEPKVVHRDVKSSNILLDRQWNPKVSDFGLAKLLGSERSYVTTRVMGTYGYVAPEYASTGMLTEKSDVYSFGVLIMEIISGRRPIDYNQVPGEVNLVEWLKKMVGNRRSEQVVDAKIPEHPSSRALKRALLVALRCVDPDSQKRPKMGHVIHMLEDLRIGREASCSHQNHSHDKQVMESSDRSEDEGRKNSNTQTRWS